MKDKKNILLRQNKYYHSLCNSLFIGRDRMIDWLVRTLHIQQIKQSITEDINNTSSQCISEVS